MPTAHITGAADFIGFFAAHRLLKVTKRLLVNCNSKSQIIIGEILKSHITQQELIASQVLLKDVKSAGVYGLIMKINSDNLPQSHVNRIKRWINESGVRLFVTEPQVDSIFLIHIKHLMNYRY